MNVDVLERGLRDLYPGKTMAAREKERVLEIAKPLPVYAVSLTDAATENWPEKARQVAWRHLVSGADFAGAADITLLTGAKTPEFASFAEGEGVKGLVAAIETAARLFERTEQHYEMRIVEIAALYAAAVWLAGPDSMFIPYLDGRSRRGGLLEVQPDYVRHITDLARRTLETPPASSR